LITTRDVSYLSILIIVGLLDGCARGPSGKQDPQSWFIESYANGVITVLHDGYTYKATCDSSKSFNNASSVTDPNNVHEFQTCDLAIGLVGHNVPPFESKQKNANGEIINMWSVGSTLALRTWRDEQKPWRHEEFKITSVTPESK
jgi:hypothetical protein